MFIKISYYQEKYCSIKSCKKLFVSLKQMDNHSYKENNNYYVDTITHDDVLIISRVVTLNL
jgi:hypothetical protein